MKEQANYFYFIMFFMIILVNPLKENSSPSRSCSMIWLCMCLTYLCTCVLTRHRQVHTPYLNINIKMSWCVECATSRGGFLTLESSLTYWQLGIYSVMATPCGHIYICSAGKLQHLASCSILWKILTILKRHWQMNLNIKLSADTVSSCLSV